MILDRIIETKRIEVAQQKERVSINDLRGRLAALEMPSFLEAIKRPDINIVAEIKYRSPSHGPFLCQDAPETVADQYADNGAAAISVLTDETFFGGSLQHLEEVSEHLRGRISVPLLRKDFIIDQYQVVEARSAGASAYLLIAACLDKGELARLQEAGREFGLDSLVEVHDCHELDAAVETGAKIIGVNNRDLRSFAVNVNTSFEIAKRMEGVGHCTLVSESGITDSVLIEELRDAGFSAFLIGTAFMDSADPAKRLRELLSSE
jgi:indole-3-glycerol phosphate synthase